MRSSSMKSTTGPPQLGMTERTANGEKRNAAFLRLQHANTELRHFGVQSRRFQRCDYRLARFRRIDDLVDPQPRRPVARVGLLVVGRLDFVEQLLLVFFAQLLAAALQLFDLNL